MKRIVPIVLAIIIALFIVMGVDPIEHPKYMIGKWDTEKQAAYTLKPFGLCLSQNIPGRWYVKDGYVYLSALFAYEEAEIISETEWIMHEKDPVGVHEEYQRQWTKIE